MTSRAIRRGQLYALAAMVIWSTNYILGRVLADAVSPVTISTFRAVVACIMMGAWLSLTRGWPRRTPGLIRPFLVAGFLGIFASQYLTYQALHWTFASTATILNAVSPIVSAVLAIAAGLAPFSRELFTGLAVSGLGAALLTVLGAPAGRGISIDLGAVLIIASTVTWGLYNIKVQRLGRILPPLAVAEGAMLAGLPFLFAALAVEHPPHLLGTIREHLAPLVFLAIGPSAIAYVCWNAAVRDLGVGQAMAFNNTLPLFGIVSGALVLHEHVTAVHLLASILIIGGIFLAIRAHPGMPAEHSRTAPSPRPMLSGAAAAPSEERDALSENPSRRK
jgi:drug/metabolite transporter (DMT)-like permease